MDRGVSWPSDLRAAVKAAPTRAPRMQLSDAAWKLNDADAAVRDAAQKEILAAKSAAIPHLVNALKKPGAPVARIALFLAALNGVEGVPALVELVERGMLDMDARTVVSRALAELVTSAH